MDFTYVFLDHLYLFPGVFFVRIANIKRCKQFVQFANKPFLQSVKVPLFRPPLQLMMHLCKSSIRLQNMLIQTLLQLFNNLIFIFRILLTNRNHLTLARLLLFRQPREHLFQIVYLVIQVFNTLSDRVDFFFRILIALTHVDFVLF